MGCPYCNSTNIGLNAGKIVCNSCNRSWSPGGVEGQPIRVKRKYTKSNFLSKETFLNQGLDYGNIRLISLCALFISLFFPAYLNNISEGLKVFLIIVYLFVGWFTWRLFDDVFLKPIVKKLGNKL